jgi:tRNA threonylcarbamoyladenosine biosynthesis protein TsaB
MDTSTSLVGAACLDGAAVLSEVTEPESRRHAELLMPLVERALHESGQGLAQVSRVVTGVGPGPFTGLRVGVVTALTMARCLRVPVLGVCSLDALAAQARAWMLAGAGPDPAEILVATDARRREVYWARYTVGPEGVERRGEPAVGAAADLPERVRRLPCVGRGALLYPDALRPLATPLDGLEPSLLDVQPGTLGLLAAHSRHVRPAEPLYLRRPDAQPQPVVSRPASASA